MPEHGKETITMQDTMVVLESWLRGHDLGATAGVLGDPLGDRVAEQVARHAVRQVQTMLGLLRPPPPAMLSAAVRGQPPPKVVLGFGLGCDSSVMS